MNGLDRDHVPVADGTAADGARDERVLSPAAQRALAEADARRNAAEAATRERPREINGRGGHEPIRYGDWEVKGLATDF